LLTAVSAGTYRAFRALALWLGLAALMVQSLAPAYAGLAAAGKEGASIVICTAHGFQTVQVDSDDNAVPGKSSANAQDCCTDCQAAGGFIVPSPLRFAAPFRIMSEAPQFTVAPIVLARLYSSYVTRGPPLVLV
jgi:hypothetical protein